MLPLASPQAAQQLAQCSVPPGLSLGVCVGWPSLCRAASAPCLQRKPTLAVMPAARAAVLFEALSIPPALKTSQSDGVPALVPPFNLQVQ